jgi:hypothetical protein
MLTIRPEQMKVFKPVAEVSFVNRVVRYLRKNHADVFVKLPSSKSKFLLKDIPEETVREMVKQGIARARAHGMAGEAAIVGFVVLMFLFAPNFDEHPLIQRVLTDKATAPDSRIEMLRDKTTNENWVAVRQKYNPKAWRLK